MSEILTPVELDRLCDRIADRVAARLAEAPKAKLLDRQGLAQALGLGLATVDRMRRSGRIPSVRAGRRPLFDLQAVIAALDTRDAMATGSRRA